MGMDKDLDLNSSVYNWAISFFFIGYVILQVPGSTVIAKFSPRWVLPSLAVMWGTIVCLMPVVRDYKEFWALRFILGLTQSCFYPGIIFLFGSWYTKEELGKRIMLFGAGNELSGAVGGITAGAISDIMEGVAGLSAWKWLFIIEGMLAVILGLVGYFLLPNFYHNTDWLTSEERQLAKSRIEKQGVQVVSTTYSWRSMANTLTTPYLWLMVVNVTLIGLTQNLPRNFAIILRDLGFPVAFCNYMLTPVYIFAALAAIFVGWSSDYHNGERAFHIAGVQFWIGTWYMILAAVNRGNNPVVLVFIGAYAISINMSMGTFCMAWLNEFYKQDNNTRAFVIAFVNSVRQITSSLVNVKAWVVSDSPAFWLGKVTSMGAAYASVTITVLIWFLYRIGFRLPEATNKAINEEEEPASAATEETTIRI
ncbi:major facilitator superfamily domain-containing protein [Phascolomyces articulosus]|uniref:Major facilitator superfamily domain-containing protein n=1 Tax=Phascolomyces articulosus TaxID=60185 RepID=A0AAD5PI23_9FUNG|nr:major facilitator superfamily domain-containing protein [Phascolomyces articulosus]